MINFVPAEILEGLAPLDEITILTFGLLFLVIEKSLHREKLEHSLHLKLTPIIGFWKHPLHLESKCAGRPPASIASSTASYSWSAGCCWLSEP